ncbi:hypothetical protein DL96DRAFT_1611286 [Flagelloscypha sp. PMI_526]|nr:hypothetical protein DL96DRAFT_1611286 [Flagelloscypha sp. PMI_526]
MIFPEATNVTQSCWNQNRSSRTTNSTCYITNDTYDNLCYRCDPNYDFFGSNSKLTTSVQGMSCETRVELDLTFFDFTGLPEMFRAIDIQVADVNVTEADLRHVPTFTIRKNEKLVGDADVFIKEIFRQSSPLNTFGYGGPIKRINVAEFPRVRIDDIAGGGGTNSSLRFFTRSWADNPVSGPTVRLVKEYNDNTVLDLFANLGGIKPLSRFGFIHLFFQKRLRTATQEHYPRFFEEGGQPGDHDAGVVAFIREHLVGVLSEERGSHPDGSHIQDASLSTMVDASSTHRMSRPPVSSSATEGRRIWKIFLSNL